ncbi:MAG: hypothetical protein ABJE95_39145 [Byssovorax sp.]
MSTPRDEPSREAAAPLADHGGVLLSYVDEDDSPTLVFIPATVASRLTALTCMIDVPGARPPARGLALADGEVITVLELGKRPSTAAAGSTSTSTSTSTSIPIPIPPPAPYLAGAEWPVPGSDRAVLCLLGSVRVALIGGTVVATGVFDPLDGGGGVLWRGEEVPTLDVRALYARAETAIWAERAVSSRPSAPPSGRPGARSSSVPARPRTPVPPRPPGTNGDRS